MHPILVLRTSLYLAAALLLGVLCSAPAAAQTDWPSKPVRVVVGFPASGISDNLARAMARVLGEQTGQTFFIDNKPGAGTTIAAADVAKSAPDGYTLFMQDITSHAINASLYKKLPYDSIKDFTLVTLVASTPLVMVIGQNSQAKNVGELVAMIKAKPGDYNYGSSGIGTILHLAGELFQLSTGTKMVHVPYKGATGATLAMLGGEVTVTFATMPTAVPLVKGNKLRAIAVTTAKRAAALPDVPTMQEAGVSGYEVVLYNGILAPAKLPAEIVTRLRANIFKALQSPELKTFYANVSADVVTSASTEDFAAHLTREIQKMASAVQAAGVQAN